MQTEQNDVAEITRSLVAVIGSHMNAGAPAGTLLLAVRRLGRGGWVELSAEYPYRLRELVEVDEFRAACKATSSGAQLRAPAAIPFVLERIAEIAMSGYGSVAITVLPERRRNRLQVCWQFSAMLDMATGVAPSS